MEPSNAYRNERRRDAVQDSKFTQGPPQPDKNPQRKISLGGNKSTEPVLVVTEKEAFNDEPGERKRSESAPLMYERSKDFFFRRSNSLTEQAKHLSEEEIRLLEIDIFKPLDFYEILFRRLKESNRGEVVTSLSELDINCL